jgi:hemolysin III
MGLGQNVDSRPRLRGVLHQWAFVVSLFAGVVLVAVAEGVQARVGGAIFAGTVATMFGASALYHRVLWRPRVRRWLRRLDHAMIYSLIAGTYTPFGLLVLDGAWRISILAIVWIGALTAIVLKLAWVDAPKWLSATIGLGLGWVGAVALPQLLAGAGPASTGLVLGGGVFYSIGALVYVLRRPDPIPTIFGYHEIFHAFVIGAVCLQYAAVALIVVADG